LMRQVEFDGWVLRQVEAASALLLHMSTASGDPSRHAERCKA
jgi:hypothetical protein